MNIRKRKSTQAEREAGARNLAKWRAEQERMHGVCRPRVTHGATSPTIRARFDDKRTREGKQLQDIMDSHIESLGGPENVSPAQQSLLALMRTKYITLLLIGAYIDKQTSIMDPESGDVIRVLQKTYLAYATSLRQDLECLHGLDRAKRGKKVPSIREVIAESKK